MKRAVCREPNSSAKLLGAVAQACRHLVLEPQLDRAVNEALAAVGESSDYIRAMLLVEEVWPAYDALAHVVKNEWTRPGYLRQQGDLERGAINSEDPMALALTRELKQGRNAVYRANGLYPMADRMQAELGTRSCVNVPVMTQQGYYGTLGFDSPDAEQEWLEHDIAALQVIATALASRVDRDRQSAAAATASASAAHAQRVQLLMLEAVVAASRCLAGEIDLQSGIDAAMVELQRLTGLGRVYVSRIDSQHEYIELISESVAEGVTRILGSSHPVKFCIRKLGEPVLLLSRGDAYQSTPSSRFGLNAEFNATIGTASELIVPVLTDSQLWGCVGFDDVRAVRPWSEAEIHVLRGVANSIAAAVQRDRGQHGIRTAELARQTSEHRQLQLLKAVVAASRCLTAEADSARGVALALDCLQNLTGICRVYVYRHDRAGGFHEHYGEAVSPEVSATVFKSSDRRLFDHEFPEVVGPLMRGESVQFTPATRTGSNARQNTENATVSDLIVPIAVAGRHWGAIGFDDVKSERLWSEGEIQVLQGAASAIAAAVQRDQSQAATLRAQVEQQSAVQAERARLSSEVHDTLSQAFTATLLQLEALGIQQGRGTRIGVAELERLRIIAAFGLAEARRYAVALQPLGPAPDALIETLQELAKRCAVPGLLACEWSLRGRLGSVDPTTGAALIGITNEAVNNAIRHSRANRIEISLHCTANLITLWVVDNGGGFNTLANPVGGRATVGLMSMERRAAAVGAQLHIESTCGKGTQVRVSLPRAGEVQTEGPEHGAAQRACQAAP